MSIVHKALKKAESDEQKKAQLKEGTPLKRRVERESPSVKRLLVIFLIFLVLLVLSYFVPEYIKKRQIQKIKESIVVKSVPLNKSAKKTVLKEKGAERKGLVKYTEVDTDDSVEALNKQGIYYYSKGDYEQAKSYFSGVINKDRTNYDAYNNLGLTFKQLKNYKKALTNYEKALALNPDHKESYNNIGVLHDQLGQYADAIKAFKNAIEIDAGYVDAYFNIALTYEKMKEYKIAGKYYKEYLSFFEGKSLNSKNIASKSLTSKNSEFLNGVKKKVEILSQIK
ncbi:tetratricopeptide repeat protein [Thermodesulfobacteriota bacterium]